MNKSQKAREIIEKFPHLSKKKLGELLFKQNNILFKDSEDARRAIRNVTGSGGKNTNKWLIQSDKYIGVLPEGEKNDFSPFVLKGKRIGIVNDLHIPYHDLKAIQIALTELKKLNIDTLVLNGDIIDCYQLSRWEKDPSKRKFSEELKMLNDFLDDLKTYFKGVDIIYKLGNHEERYQKFLTQRAPELLDLEILDWQSLIKNRVPVINHKRPIKAGKLNILHGHEFGESIFSPVNAARGIYLKSKTSTIAGHSHVTSEHIERDLNDSITGCWSVGCLSDLHPDYRPINKWNYGFAFVAVEPDGDFEVHNYKIINGKIR